MNQFPKYITGCAYCEQEKRNLSYDRHHRLICPDCRKAGRDKPKPPEKRDR